MMLTTQMYILYVFEGSARLGYYRQRQAGEALLLQRTVSTAPQGTIGAKVVHRSQIEH